MLTSKIRVKRYLSYHYAAICSISFALYILIKLKTFMSGSNFISCINSSVRRLKTLHIYWTRVREICALWRLLKNPSIRKIRFEFLFFVVLLLYCGPTQISEGSVFLRHPISFSCYSSIYNNNNFWISINSIFKKGKLKNSDCIL